MKRVGINIKMRVFGAIDHAEGQSIHARILRVSEQGFVDDEGNRYQFTWRTIQTWYSRYKKHGITDMLPHNRKDRGLPRKIEPELLLEAIERVRADFRGKVNVGAIYRACIEKNLLQREQIAPTTFRRMVKKFDLLKPESEVENKARLAFSKAHANDLWQADTMHGPHVKTGAGHTPSKLIAFIDDASRVCCHAEFFLAENTDTLIKALRSALYKRGIPAAMYVDNGSIYSSKEIAQICARLGCVLLHAPVRDGAAKGKVERFFRTVRMSFLSKNLDLSSIGALNRAFTQWLENDYNAAEHSVLKMKPIDRFGIDLRRIRFLPPNEVNDELFFVEEERTVLADNTFSLKGKRFEAPRDLRNRKIQIRFDRQKFVRAVVFFKGDRMGEARPVDFLANDRKPDLTARQRPEDADTPNANTDTTNTQPTKKEGAE
jgi:putative transposase